MDQELWIFLRCWQTSGAHAGLRSLMLSLLREPGPCASLSELRERWREKGLLWCEPSLKDPEWRNACGEWQRMTERGVSSLTPAHPSYPRALLLSADPPLTLNVQGELAVFDRPALAVVGSREPAVESLRWMEDELSAFCRETGAVVVSGGARGVDQKAHSVALRSAVPTVIFLPSGVERVYPADLEKWFAAVFDGGGAVVSEYPPTSPMRKAHFHQRNRLIAACGLATLVVEARARSGTLITAHRSAEIGRPLLVVPGHPGDERFAGNLHLLSEGANMVRQKEDLTIFWQHEREYGEQLALALEKNMSFIPEP